MTGATGFLGWHVRCALRARGATDVVPISKAVFDDRASLADALSGCTTVIHTAGVNRSPKAGAMEENVLAAQQLTAALDELRSTPIVVFANSIQAGSSSAFGQAKAAAAEHLLAWGRKRGAVVADVRLPNLFGEGGRPYYNSVVATFCYELAHGHTPAVIEDREIPLLHVQDAVDQILEIGNRQDGGVYWPTGRLTRVSDLFTKLTSFHDLYQTGDIPDLGDAFDRALFNTYRSFCFPEHYPIYPVLRSDVRGNLFECLRSHGGVSLVFCSTSERAVQRGEHFHLRKVERFLVLQGTAVISLRRLFDESVIRFSVSGRKPAIVDMPTLWTHNIRNTGEHELLTLFWADELLDPNRTDTFSESVEGVVENV